MVVDWDMIYAISLIMRDVIPDYKWIRFIFFLPSEVYQKGPSKLFIFVCTLRKYVGNIVKHNSLCNQWINQDWISNSYDRYIINLSIIAISYIHLPGLQRKLSVCKQMGEGGERVLTPPLEGVVHSCS